MGETFLRSEIIRSRIGPLVGEVYRGSWRNESKHEEAMGASFKNLMRPTKSTGARKAGMRPLGTGKSRGEASPPKTYRFSRVNPL